MKTGLKKSNRVLANALLSLFLIQSALGQSLSPSELTKLHPAFQHVVKEFSGLSKMEMPPREMVSSFERDGRMFYDAIVYTENPADLRRIIKVNSVFGHFATAQVSAEDLEAVAKLPSVNYVDPGSINYPATDVSVPEIGASLLHAGFVNNTPYKGKGAIVLIYDTGIDWRHLDFRDPSDTTKSRILYIWDQTLTATGGETPPAEFQNSYGVEYTQAQINNEIDGSPVGFIREKDINGHGTHVAGTAVGNGRALGKYAGVAPEADIIVVKGGDGSFSEGRMIDGLTYAEAKASQLGKPIVVNWSIGGQSGPHDGSRPYEVAVDNFVNVAGRVVCVAAGNDGGSSIHVGGTLLQPGTTSITLSVPSYNPAPGTNNDQFVLDVWFRSNPSVTVGVLTPNNLTGSGADGTIDILNEISSLNGNRHVQLWVHDASTATPAPGTWTLNFSNASGTTTFDAWLAVNTVGASLTGGDNNKSISMPSTSAGAITVASYVTKWSWPTYDGRAFVYNGTDRTGNISLFSGIGPTADGRQKPDISAPGQGVSAALSTAVDTSTIGTRIQPGIKHWLIQGTSMATPHIAGVSALLLAARPTITAAEIKSILNTTARADEFTGTLPNYVWGNGKIDAYKAVAKAVGVTSGATRSTLSFASAARFFILLPSSNLKFAMRFTSPISGKVSAVSISLNGGASAIKGSGNLKFSVAQNTAGSVAGIPGNQIGSSVTVPFSALTAGSSNYVDMSSAGASISTGMDFHVVWEVVGGVGDTLQFLLDDGTTSPTDRASSYRNGVNGLAWYNRADPNYAPSRASSFENFLITVYIANPVSDVVEISGLVPTEFTLSPVFPNPFNPATVIRYTIPEKGYVRLRVFDVLGREVATLVDQEQNAGSFETKWNSNEGGRSFPSGVYFARLEQRNRVATQKMVLLK
jgi:subtilisin family serine protease